MKKLDWNGTRIEFDRRRDNPFDSQGRPRYGMSGDWGLSNNSGWNKVEAPMEDNAYDIYATPGGEEGEIYLYTACGDKIDHTKATVNASGFKYEHDVTRNEMPSGYKVGRVRVARPLSPPFRDEDPTALRDLFLVMYGLCEVSAGKSDIVADNTWKNKANMEVRAYYYDNSRQLVAPSNKSFLAPWRNIRGIGVDRRYLWVFRVGEIACATHASVKACLNDNRAQPSWNTYTIPPRPIDPKDLAGKVYDGLLDLAPCDDGTLTAAVGLWSGPLYTMVPRIDRKAKTIVIDRWRPLDEALKNPSGPSKAFRVHKQPVVGWNILEGLMEALEKASTTLTIEQESVLGGEDAHGTIDLPLQAAENIMVAFTSSDKEAILAPDPITIKKGIKSHAVSIKTKPTGQDEVATITAVLSTSFSTFQPLEMTTTLKTVPVTFTVDHSVLGGRNAHGTIALSIPAAEDIAVTFDITSYRKVFVTPDPITIKKGTTSRPVLIKTKKTAKNVRALITATALSPPTRSP